MQTHIQYLAPVVHFLPPACRCGCHAAERWAGKSPAGSYGALSSPSWSSAAHRASPPPGDRCRCEAHAGKDIWFSDNDATLRIVSSPEVLWICLCTQVQYTWSSTNLLNQRLSAILRLFQQPSSSLQLLIHLKGAHQQP